MNFYKETNNLVPFDVHQLIIQQSSTVNFLGNYSSTNADVKVREATFIENFSDYAHATGFISELFFI